MRELGENPVCESNLAFLFLKTNKTKMGFYVFALIVAVTYLFHPSIDGMILYATFMICGTIETHK